MTAVATIDRHTGEVLDTAQHFSITDYLASVNTPAAFNHQQQLAVAYDSACRALIGPNDVQKEGNREFKKKSAWRKLARHFTISVSCDPKEARIDHLGNGEWVAVAGALATAPWGQTFADVGACGSDEETGRRTITYADAIATAMTRASNRAVSNLIAMGEVSAEEIGNRRSFDAPRQAQATDTGVPLMAFGKSKGAPVDQVPPNDLDGAIAWATEKGKYAEFIEAVAAWRQGGAA